MLRFLMLTVAAATVLVIMSVSDVSAQGRGHGHGNWDNDNWDNGRPHGNWGWSKKCEKFVNCHDARDGRWDNRGPRHLSLRSRYYSGRRYYSPYAHTHVYRGDWGRRVYGQRFYVRSRRRY